MTQGFQMNIFSQEAQERSKLFESIAEKYEFKPMNGRFGGEYNNDQLAFNENNGKISLLLGLKVTDASGNLQLDTMSMGPFQQLSLNWLLAVIECLKLDNLQAGQAKKIESALKSKRLDIYVLVLDRTNGESKIIRIAAPE